MLFKNRKVLNSYNQRAVIVLYLVFHFAKTVAKKTINICFADDSMIPPRDRLL
jgi:hypothetical protein